jgi:hypothetical protein
MAWVSDKKQQRWMFAWRVLQEEIVPAMKRELERRKAALERVERVTQRYEEIDNFEQLERELHLDLEAVRMFRQLGAEEKAEAELAAEKLPEVEKLPEAG